MKIIIPLAPITKKNSQRIFVNSTTGKPFIAPSAKFKGYQHAAGYYLNPNNGVDNYPVNIKCLFYMPTKRRCDLTNLLEAIDDVLTHYGIISDDDYLHIGGHDGSRVYYDKNNPRTEIYITPLESAGASDKI